MSECMYVSPPQKCENIDPNNSAITKHIHKNRIVLIGVIELTRQHPHEVRNSH